MKSNCLIVKMKKDIFYKCLIEWLSLLTEVSDKLKVLLDEIKGIIKD